MTDMTGDIIRVRTACVLPLRKTHCLCLQAGAVLGASLAPNIIIQACCFAQQAATACLSPSYNA